MSKCKHIFTDWYLRKTLKQCKKCKEIFTREEIRKMYPENFRVIPLKVTKDTSNNCFLESRGML